VTYEVAFPLLRWAASGIDALLTAASIRCDAVAITFAPAHRAGLTTLKSRRHWDNAQGLLIAFVALAASSRKRLVAARLERPPIVTLPHKCNTVDEWLEQYASQEAGASAGR